jgi:hypothetical protein
MADVFSKIGISKKTFIAENVAPAADINRADTYMYGGGTTTVSTLMGYGKRQARARQTIYEKWALMESDPLCSSSLRLITTSALGGDKTDGQMIFIEENPAYAGGGKYKDMVKDMQQTLHEVFNDIAFQSCYSGLAFGDAYARIYSKDGKGVINVHTDEMYRAPLVYPFEKGSTTVGFSVFLGKQNYERLDVTQMARLKMPRTQWVPQLGVIEKNQRIAVKEDDIENLPIMPSMVGGSILYAAEDAYDNFSAALLGLVGHRFIDSMDEQMVSVNLESMTKEQQDRFMTSIVKMLKKSKELAENAAKSGTPVLERIRHIIPVFNEKQLTQITGPAGGTGRNGTLTIDDVIFHAKLLTGTIGVDIAMVGFADQLSGGLGDGGFFRMSAQAAENSRVIRSASSKFFNSICDIHTLKKYGVVFPANNRPWKINFYGSISALEAEEQRTQADSMNAGLLLVQAIQQFKEVGATKDMMFDFLTTNMRLSEAQAKKFAPIVDQKTEAPAGFGGSEDQPEEKPDEPI